MYVTVCMYVCIHVCMYVCIHVCMYVLIFVDSSVTPNSIIRLDISPYNEFQLTCNITVYPLNTPSNLISATFQWPQEDSYGVGSVSSDGVISDLFVTLSSILSDNETYVYECTSEVTINGLTAMITNTSIVTVKGIAYIIIHTCIYYCRF